jgi:hypothetical protein
LTRSPSAGRQGAATGAPGQNGHAGLNETVDQRRVRVRPARRRRSLIRLAKPVGRSSGPAMRCAPNASRGPVHLSGGRPPLVHIFPSAAFLVDLMNRSENKADSGLVAPAHANEPSTRSRMRPPETRTNSAARQLVRHARPSPPPDDTSEPAGRLTCAAHWARPSARPATRRQPTTATLMPSASETLVKLDRRRDRSGRADSAAPMGRSLSSRPGGGAQFISHLRGGCGRLVGRAAGPSRRPVRGGRALWRARIARIYRPPGDCIGIR